MLRAITRLPWIRAMSVVRSSVIASAKYSCSGSLLRLVNGSTTIDSRGAECGGNRGRAADAAASSCAIASSCRSEDSHHAPPARATISRAAAAGPRRRLPSEGHPAAETDGGARPSDAPAIVKARTGSAMFLTRCSPSGTKATRTLVPT